MKFLISAFALAVSLGALPGSATAAPTKIAQLPLLNMDNTGLVKPNLMLLYDNSGSMASNYTPDYIADTTTCRSRSTLALGSRACTVGMPPFNAAEFNRQYYNPAVLYSPPVDASGNVYPSQTGTGDGNPTTGWTKVKNDGFNVNKKDLRNVNVDTTDLTTGFPDLQWCDSDKNTDNCKRNTATYDYPDNTYIYPAAITGAPYYYTIRVAEYCSDKNLTVCVTTAADAPAPAGYPFPAKQRWCDSTALTNCQAKFSDTTFKYPRFSSPNGGSIVYGTIRIDASTSAGSIPINSVSILEKGTTSVTITNNAVTATTGTNTTAKQAALADALAASIINKTGLTNQYAACVYKPITAGVPSCASLGITLPSASTTVAVVPLTCPKNVTDKSQCSLLSDTSRNGWALTVDAPTVVSIPEKAAIATLTVTGTAAKVAGNTAASQLSGLTLNGVQLINNQVFGSSVSNTTVALQISKAISGTKITAVVGGTTGACSTSANVVCISTTASYASGQKLVLGSVSSAGSLVFKTTDTAAGAAPVSDRVPTTTTPLGAGADVFVRTDIVPNKTYPKADKRTDCAGSTCTYAEEMTNFANWYTYYKTRNQMMKTAVGQAFQPIDSNFNVGLTSLSGAAGGKSADMIRPKPFETTSRTTWYAKLYAMDGGSTTPLRAALNNVGKMYANQGDYAMKAGEEVVQYACQQNYTFMTTDGYWNGGANGAPAGVTNNDYKEDPDRFCLAATGCVDKRTSTAGSLADTALFWYNGGFNDRSDPSKIYSLRESLEDPAAGIVPGTDDDNRRLHMNTYTLGLGVDGVMTYEDAYDTKPEPGGDFYNLTHGVTTGCPWNGGGAYTWPDPVVDSPDSDYQTRVDDLWHAAINGHGKYFKASDPGQVVSGLRSALSNIKAHAGSAASSATSTPNLSLSDNDIFSTSFTTVLWSGELTDKKIDPITGIVDPKVIWTSNDTVGTKVGASSDTRTIFMRSASGAAQDFKYENLTATEKTWFDNKCVQLAQCAALTVTDRATVNNGATIVNWLRGQQQYANDVILRAYSKTKGGIPIVLGDIASSKPAYVRNSRKYYSDSDYDTFKATNEKRKATVYVGSNDGMLHAFDAKTGEELWAYVPRITMKKLYVQAGTTYGTAHQYTVDGAPEAADVLIGKKWRTVLVSGLNGGGRGYFALDITEPTKPVPLWETCADSNICAGINNEPQLGLTFGNPQIGTWKDGNKDEQWVVYVTSGYNNIPNTDGVATGNGQGWLMILDIATGQVLKKISTGAGDTTTPSGLARAAAITSDPNYDPLVTNVYAGDTLGKMWRFDTKTLKAISLGDVGASQPITSRPEVTYCEYEERDKDNKLISTSTNLMVAFGTGRLLDVDDLSNVDKQSLYVIKDPGTDPSPTWSSGNLAKQTLTRNAPANGVVTYTTSGAAADLKNQRGWYVDFDTNKGERVNLDPQVVHGAINLITNIPAKSTSCKVGGTSVVYAFNVCSGKAGADGIVGRPVPGSAATVGFILATTSSGELKVEGKLADGSDITVPGGDVSIPVSRRAGWRRIRN